MTVMKVTSLVECEAEWESFVLVVSYFFYKTFEMVSHCDF